MKKGTFQTIITLIQKLNSNNITKHTIVFALFLLLFTSYAKAYTASYIALRSEYEKVNDSIFNINDSNEPTATYSIASGNTGNAFQINATTGLITVKTVISDAVNTTTLHTLVINAVKGTTTHTYEVKVYDAFDYFIDQNPSMTVITQKYGVDVVAGDPYVPFNNTWGIGASAVENTNYRMATLFNKNASNTTVFLYDTDDNSTAYGTAPIWGYPNLLWGVRNSYRETLAGFPFKLNQINSYTINFNFERLFGDDYYKIAFNNFFYETNDINELSKNDLFVVFDQIGTYIPYGQYAVNNGDTTIGGKTFVNLYNLEETGNETRRLIIKNPDDEWMSGTINMLTIFNNYKNGGQLNFAKYLQNAQVGIEITKGFGAIRINNWKVNMNIDNIITFPALATKTFNDADFNPGATVSSGLNITYASSDPTVATIVNGKIHIVGAGTAVITATQNGDAYHSAATAVNQTLTVNRDDQVITFPAFGTRTDGDADFNTGATVSPSGFAINYTSGNTAVATIVGGKIHIVGPGTSVITANCAGNTDYKPATAVAKTLTVVSLPTPWLSTDIGSPASANSSSYASNVFTANGEGTDMNGTTDEFRFIYQPLTGNGEIVAKVTSVENTSIGAKAGIMIRETLNPGSKSIFLFQKPDKTVRSAMRSTSGATTTYFDASEGGTAAVKWLKLVRTANTISMYYSTTSNTAWIPFTTATATLAMTTNDIYMGMFVTSVAPNTLCTATFTDVTTVKSAAFSDEELFSEDTKNSNFEIFPNPAKTVVNIKLTSKEITTVEIYNLLGKRVFTQSGVEKIITINTSDFGEKGMFFVKINGEMKKLKVE